MCKITKDEKRQESDRRTCYTERKSDKRALPAEGSAEREAGKKKNDYMIGGAGLDGAGMAYEVGEKGGECPGI